MTTSNSALDLDADPKEAANGVYWEGEDDPEKRGPAAKAAFSTIEDEQAAYREKTFQHMQMYRNVQMMGYVAKGNSSVFTYAKTPLSLNIVRNMVNAVHSRITRNRVKAQMQTKGAGWEEKELARDLEAYGTALALKEGLYKKSPYSFLDAAVTGNGIIKTYPSKSRNCVVFERPFAPNVVVDFGEGADATQTPAHIYEVKYVSKRTLGLRYKDDAKKVEAIRSLATASVEGDTFYAMQESDSTDRVRIVECYYFNPDDEYDGFLSIITDSGIELEGAKWTMGNPYSVCRWSNGNLGWYGMGLAEELRGIQTELNRLVRKIQAAQSLLGNPYVFADRSSNIEKKQFTDIMGSIILYNGKRPDVVAPTTTNPEIYQHVDRLYQRGYEIAGISQLSAHGEKPAGVESGRAMLVYDDIADSDRFASVHREWSDMHVDAIQKGILAGKQLGAKYKVPIYGRSNYKVMSFGDLKERGLEDDSWVVHPMAASLLGDTPTGQVDNIDKMMEKGLINDPADLAEEMLSPDVQTFLALQSSPKRVIQMAVGEMLSGGDYVSPEPQDNLALALETANKMYQHARTQKCPEARLAKVRDYMLMVKSLLSRAAKTQAPTTGATVPQAPSQAPMLPPGGPPGGGMPPQLPAPM